MSVRSVPTSSAARDAADRIVDRRTFAGDPELVELDDSLEGVVAHVARLGAEPIDHGAARQFSELATASLRDDVVDALAVLDYLDDRYARNLARLRLQLIRAGRRAGMTPTMLMVPLHQRHRQGVDEMAGRLDAYLSGYRRSTKDARAAAADAAAEADAIAAGITSIQDLAGYLIDNRDRLPDELGEECGVDLDDLADRLPGGIYASPAGLVGALRQILEELADRPLDAELRAAIEHGAQFLPPKRPETSPATLTPG